MIDEDVPSHAGAAPRRIGTGSVSSLKDVVPPVEVSRLLLLAFVGVSAALSVATTGVLSSFAGGFAAGAGSVFVVSFLKNPRRDAPDEGPEAR